MAFVPQILQDFSLQVPSGKRVALVGESGCGKSTIVKLVERFYDPVGGAVLVDGHDIKDINVSHLRKYIGVVNQEPTLFSTSIAENIAYGAERVTQHQIEEAAKMANAHDFIINFPRVSMLDFFITVVLVRFFLLCLMGLALSGITELSHFYFFLLSMVVIRMLCCATRLF